MVDNSEVFEGMHIITWPYSDNLHTKQQGTVIEIAESYPKGSGVWKVQLDDDSVQYFHYHNFGPDPAYYPVHIARDVPNDLIEWIQSVKSSCR